MPLLLLFVLLAFVEISLLIRAADALGGLQTFGLVVLTAVGGLTLARAQGSGLMQRLQRELGEGRVPEARPIEAFLLLFAGALLVVPGFLTDAVGLLLLLPPARRALARSLQARFATGHRGGVFVHLSGRMGAGRAGPDASAGEPPDGPGPTAGAPRRTLDGTPIRDVPVVQHPPAADDAPADDGPPRDP